MSEYQTYEVREALRPAEGIEPFNAMLATYEPLAWPSTTSPLQGICVLTSTDSSAPMLTSLVSRSECRWKPRLADC